MSPCVPTTIESVNELACKLGITTRTVFRWKQAGLPCERVSDHRVRFHMLSVAGWIRQRYTYWSTLPLTGQRFLLDVLCYASPLTPISASELASMLNVPTHRVDGWIMAGMPRERVNNQTRLNVLHVGRWLRERCHWHHLNADAQGKIFRVLSGVGMWPALKTPPRKARKRIA